MQSFSLRRLSLVILLLMGMILSACSPKTTPETKESSSKTGGETVVSDDTPEDQKKGGTMKLNFSAPTISLDPAQYFSNQNYTPGYHIYEGPLSIDEQGNIHPNVCSYEMSEDNLTLKLTVRDGITFHDGSPVTAEDVHASIARYLKFSSMGQTNLGQYIADSKVIDDKNLEYTFSSVAPIALLELGSLPNGCKVMPATIAEEAGEEFITDDAKIIGTGPYKLKNWTRDVSVTLERYEDYKPSESTGTGPAAPKKAYFDEIFITVASDQMTRTTGMIAGEYDYTTSIVLDMVPQLEEAGCFYDINWNGWSPTLHFNLSEHNKDSVVHDVNFRKAVRACMDMEQIMMANKSTPEFYKLNGNIVPETSVYYNDAMNDEYNIKDLEKAKEYLEASSYNGETIRWICAESDSYYKTSLPASEMLKAIGVNVDLQVMDPAAYDSAVVDPTAPFDICARENQKPVFNPLLSDRYVSGNVTGWWESPARTAALEKLSRQVTGSPESIEAFKEFCQVVNDEVPYLICGEFGTQCFYSQNVVPDRQGIDVYWWNSYFKK